MKRIYLLRTARNLLLAALAALLIWWTAGFPLPTPELTFRRAERQALAERSELVWQYEGIVGGDEDLLVGLADRFVHVWHPNGYVLSWPRQEGGTLVPLPAETRYQDQGSSYTGPALLVPDPPEGAESARLTITLSINNWMEDYIVGGTRQGQVFFFQLEMRHQNDAHSMDEATGFSWLTYERPDFLGLSQYPYTLEFFDGEGQLLSTVRQEGWLEAAG